MTRYIRVDYQGTHYSFGFEKGTTFKSLKRDIAGFLDLDTNVIGLTIAGIPVNSNDKVPGRSHSNSSKLATVSVSIQPTQDNHQIVRTQPEQPGVLSTLSAVYRGAGMVARLVRDPSQILNKIEEFLGDAERTVERDGHRVAQIVTRAENLADRVVDGLSHLETHREQRRLQARHNTTTPTQFEQDVPRLTAPSSPSDYDLEATIAASLRDHNRNSESDSDSEFKAVMELSRHTGKRKARDFSDDSGSSKNDEPKAKHRKSCLTQYKNFKVKKESSSDSDSPATRERNRKERANRSKRH